jgi:hypothetical protein
MRFLVIVLLAAAPGLAQTCPSGAATLIDNFTKGHVGPLLLTGANQSLDRHQLAANVPGGVRREFFENTANPFRQVAEFGVLSDPTDPTGGGALVVGTGAREFFRIELFYGIDVNNNLAPLHYFPPSDCDRFRVTFDSSDLGVNFNFEAWTPANGVPDQIVFDDGINMDGSTGPFCIEFPFAHFGTNTQNATQDFVHTGIDLILPILQSGSATGANDFALKRIELAGGNGSVNGVPCTIAPDFSH